MTKTAFIFPGQGSQSVGMLQTYLHEAIIVRTLEEASSVLSYDLVKLISSGPEEQLNQTEFTQPAILAASIALYRLWCEKGGKTPDFVAGHSLGEYSALVAANSLLFSDALTLVALRGRLMQTAVPEGEGAMTAVIGLDNDRLNELCKIASEGQVIAPANFNAPGQIVVAGAAQAVKRLMALAEPESKMVIALPVSVPSHCDLMRPAADAFAHELKNISLSTPKIPVIHNVNCMISTNETSIQNIQQALITQLYSPVKWVDSIEKLISLSVTQFIECGPGRVLTGLNKRINRQCRAESLDQYSQFEILLSEFS